MGSRYEKKIIIKKIFKLKYSFLNFLKNINIKEINKKRCSKPRSLEPKNPEK